MFLVRHYRRSHFNKNAVVCSLVHQNRRTYQRHHQKIHRIAPKMEHWAPPHSVRGMVDLDRDKFRKTIKIPQLDVSELNINSVLPHLKHCLFKMERLKPLQVKDDGVTKRLLLNPSIVRTWHDLPDDVRNSGVTGAHLTLDDFEICYENWKPDQILRAVLPEHQESVTSFSRIGHIIHLNLRDHLLPYKRLIGEVLMDKTANVRTVVNKSQTIENTFRNFELELICGVPEYEVEVKENGTIFQFDFSLVYWNPRLATEHERIIKLLQPGDVLYDVFAGVGPFSVPAGRRKCQSVLANDLNPHSFKWLEQNVKRNKVTKAVTPFNKDGREFILTDLRTDLLKRWNEEAIDAARYSIHIVMNLPAKAVEFLDAFRGLITVEESSAAKQHIFPFVHIYCFVKGEKPAVIARCLAESHLGLTFGQNLEGVHFVRNVAPNKDMYRISFYLTEEILCTKIAKPVKRAGDVPAEGEPSTKKSM